MPNEENPNSEDFDKEIFKAAIEKELRENEKYKAYFEKFSPASVDSFIKHFANHKQVWFQDAAYCIKGNEKEDMRWIDEATEHLEIIQQKKLFDVQCQWRGETINIDEVSIAFDFKVWEKNVLQCPFIEPITERDIELYQSYLASSDIDLDNHSTHGLQDYENIKLAYQTDNEDGNRNFPEWYYFHNVHTGASAYLLLPDIRGKKEAYYRGKSYEGKKEEYEKNRVESEKNRDKRSYLHVNNDEIDDFVETFEDITTKQYYKAYTRRTQNLELDELLEINNFLDLLYEAEEIVPIEAHYDFKEALRNAKKRFSANKIIEFLPFALKDYEIARSMDFGPSEETLKSVETALEIREFYAKPILEGRKLYGEPEDFNF